MQQAPDEELEVKWAGKVRPCPKPKPKETEKLRGWLGVTSYFKTKNYIGES